MVKGNLVALLIYVMCGLEWSDDIKAYTKLLDIEDNKLRV